MDCTKIGKNIPKITKTNIFLHYANINYVIIVTGIPNNKKNNAYTKNVEKKHAHSHLYQKCWKMIPFHISQKGSKNFPLLYQKCWKDALTYIKNADILLGRASHHMLYVYKCPPLGIEHVIAISKQVFNWQKFRTCHFLCDFLLLQVFINKLLFQKKISKWCLINV